MPNKNNIKKYQFKKGQSGNPKGRPKGAKNRSTVARKWLDSKRKYLNPETGQEELMTLEDILTLMQIQKGISSKDTSAYNAIMNSRYGQAKADVDINADVPTIDFRKLFNFNNED
tara:strand:+ start:183 stop:527 length:345 start_codon:yes stop_codon:yes gene_type:complete